jgi:hypothetical protein
VPTGGDGKYLFVGLYQMGGTGTFLGRASIRANGTDYKSERGVPILTSLSQHIMVAAIVNLVATNYMELVAFQDSGSPQSVFGARFVGCRLKR